MRPNKAQLLAFGATGAVIAIGLIAIVARFDLRAQADRAIEFFRAAGPVPFFAAMALLPGVGFPLSAFLAVAGPVFGPTMGVAPVVLCAIAAVMINVALTYWIAARAMRPVMERLVRRLGYRLPEIQPHLAWTAILILRIVPGTPFCLQSFLLGLARVPFGTYMLISTLVPSAYVTAVILLGDAIIRGDRVAMAWAGALFLAAGVVLHVARKRVRSPGPSPVTAKLAPDQRS